MSAARDVRARPVVVVVCAEAEAAALTPIIRGLVARGMRVDLVPVPEGDMHPLEQALEQFRTIATYAVCHTSGLERYTADLCVLTIRAAEVPEARLVAAWCDLDDPDGFVQMVADRATASNRKATPTPPDPDPDPSTHASARPVPQVIVHAPAPLERRGPAPHESAAASTRVAMRMALGWRRILRPATYLVVAVVAVGAGLYFGGYQAIAGAAF